MIRAAVIGAKLVIMGAQPVVIHYPTMERCLAAKAVIERQAQEAQRNAGQYIIVPKPTVYCVPE